MGKHWLMTATTRAGYATPDSLPITAATPIGEAWTAVAQAVGISEEQLAAAVARMFHLQVAELERTESRAARLVPERIARQFGLLALRETDREIVVATSDPTNPDAEQAVAFAAGRRPVLEVASPRRLQAALDGRFQVAAPAAARAPVTWATGPAVLPTAAVLAGRPAAPAPGTPEDATAEPVARLGNLILTDGVLQGASEVRVAVGRGAGVFFRVDGVVRPYADVPPAMLPRVVGRLKFMARLDLAEHSRPQQGRASVRVDGREFELRIATEPGPEGEQVSARIMRGEFSTNLGALDLEAATLARLRALIGQRSGLVLVAGPAGSGKSTTIYAAVHELTAGRVTIMTVEHQLEHEIPGMRQLQVGVPQGQTAASALRAILRENPDVIVLDEIRDPECAQLAAEAAAEGKLVLGAVRANDAVSVVARLADLGLTRAAMADVLRGIVAQRLFRRVCRECARPAPEPAGGEEQRLAKRFGMPPTVRAMGCKRCGDTGYRGRFAVLEVMTATPTLLHHIDGGASVLDLARAAAAEGMVPVQRGALERVRAGETTLAEVERALQESLATEAARALRRPHVLVVDDDMDTLLLARAILEREGLRVSEAADGMVALGRISAGEHFSLVVLDLSMPNLDGAEVLERLKASPATAALPVVILTGAHLDEGTEARLMDAGADDYIRKPIEPARFLARVRAALRRAGALP